LGRERTPATPARPWSPSSPIPFGVEMTDIGAMLREARMRDHLDIAEFEARTKIRAKYLRALEDEEWALLPGYTFAKAFLRTYADMLGLDGRMMVDEFKRQYQDPSEIELAPVLPSRRDSRRARERGGDRGRERGGDRGRERRNRPSGPSSRVLLVALLVVLLAAALFVVRVLLNKKSPKHPPAKTRTTQTHTTTTTHHAPAPTRVALELVPSASVHVCLIGYRTAGGSGLQRLNAVLTASSPARVYHADNRFLVSFVGGAVRMIVNGRSVPVAATATAASFEILANGHSVALPAAKAPRCL
jgi:helix-turn-helix protein